MSCRERDGCVCRGSLGRRRPHDDDDDDDACKTDTSGDSSLLKLGGVFVAESFIQCAPILSILVCFEWKRRFLLVEEAQ